MKALKDIVTGIDGETHDIARWIAAAASLEGLGLVAYDVIWQHAHFDLQTFGIGLGAVLVSLGAALRLKQDTEPK
jgi:hypothetical protein